MSTTLGIDLGTQHLKALVYDAGTRRILSSAMSPLEIDQRQDGSAEQQAQWWIDALHDALSQLDKQSVRSVSAIGVSGQQHGFVPIDKSGAVLAPVKLWCDTSTENECDQLTEAMGGVDSCIKSAGNPILPGYTASKVLWFKQTHPKLYEQMDCVLLPHDYLNYYLTGEHCMEAGDASGTGFLDVRERRWSSEMLKALDPERDLSASLPPLRTDNEFIGELRAEVAAATGLPAGIPVSTGGGDNMMGAIGTGNVAAGRMTVSLGTSGTVYAYSDTPVVDPQGEIAAFCSSTGGWLPLLCTMNCTVTTELVRGLLGADIEAFETLVAGAPRGAGGILTLPFFNGERTPNLPRGKGCLVGIDANNASRDNLLRSAMEGATFALRFGIDRLADLGVTADEIVLTGGGANSATWRQLIADVCDRRVTVLEQSEGAALGAALQALAALDKQPVEAIVGEHLSAAAELGCEPEKSAVELYSDVYRSYQSSVDAITPLYQ
ncbi:MAG: xylulokinase [Pseudomonadota bacterium]